MPEGLKIQVGASVEEANQKLKSLATNVDTTFSGISSSINRSGKSFVGFQTNVTKATGALKGAGRQVNIFEGTIEDLRARIGARQSFLNVETDINKIKQLNKEISLLELQVSHLSNTGRTRFDQLGNSITKTGHAARQSAAQINVTGLSIAGIGEGAKKAVAGLLRISYLLPGIGFAGLVGGILAVGGALFGLGGSADKTATDFESLSEALKLQQEEQEKFQQELDKSSQKVLSHASTLDDLKSVLIDVTKVTRDLTKSTINLGVARFLFDKKTLAVQELLSAEIERQLQLRKQQRPLADVEEITDDTFSKNPLKRKVAAAKDAVRQVNDLSFGLEGLFSKLFEEDFKSDAPRIAKNVKDFFQKFFLERPIPVESFSFAIKGVKFTLLGGVVKTFAEQVQDKINADIEKLARPVTINLAPQVVANQAAQAKFIESQKALAGIFGIQGESPLSKMQKEAVFAAQAIRDVLAPAFTGLFDAILKGESPIKAFFQSLGQAVTQLITKLIQAAITAAILSAIFPTGVNGVKGFGNIFKNLIGFAAGGIVSGPTLALIGEGAGTSRSNPEVVAPLDQLRSMLSDMGGGGRQQVIVTGRLRGNDMLLQNARTSRSQRRTTGR